MDGALVDVGSHHPKKRNDNHYVFFCWSKQGHGFLNFVM
jgi:hypothetical protein